MKGDGEEGFLQNSTMDRTEDLAELRRTIIDLAVKYAEMAHRPRAFVPGTTQVPVSGKVLGSNEMRYLISSSLDFWLTLGRFNHGLESSLSSRFEGRPARTVNSGSSANLVAISSLTSSTLGKEALRSGDEIITVAAAFPTTVNPIIQNGLVPVFIDVDIPTYNINTEQLKQAIGPRTMGILIAHTLGNPFDLKKVCQLAEQNKLWLIEDCCDALGSTYDGRPVGTFGDLATLSFYPAHHITTGEGGAVISKDDRLDRIVTSVRDWGRDCYCEPGKDNTCGRRFDGKYGELPQGYDHKYVYSNLGYNLKISDMQAAVGLSQMGSLDGFISKRKRNFAYLKERLRPMRDVFFLPEATERSDPSWFGFPLTIKEGTGIGRVGLLKHLEKRKVGTRLLFGGNITKQPYMLGQRFRVSGELTNTDIIMDRTFWIGLYPGIDEAMMDYMIQSLTDYVESASR